MRRRGAIFIASVTRSIPFLILTVALAGCSPSAPEASVDETTVPDPIGGASTGNAALDSEPAAPEAPPEAAAAESGAAPVLVVETAKGTIEIETYPDEAPKTVEHIVNAGREEVLQRAARTPGSGRIRCSVRRSANARHDQARPMGIGGKWHADRRFRGQSRTQAPARGGRGRSPRRSKPSGQPDLHRVRAAT